MSKIREVNLMFVTSFHSQVSGKFFRMRIELMNTSELVSETWKISSSPGNP